MIWPYVLAGVVGGYVVRKVAVFALVFVTHVSETGHRQMILVMERRVQEERQKFRSIHGKEAPVSGGRGY